jgi:hypothetical protein
MEFSERSLTAILLALYVRPFAGLKLLAYAEEDFILLRSLPLLGK